MDVAHFVEQNKKCIAEDEFYAIDELLLRKVPETRLILERPRNVFYSRLESTRNVFDTCPQ
jgi:hypothetical protein